MLVEAAWIAITVPCMFLATAVILGIVREVWSKAVRKGRV